MGSSHDDKHVCFKCGSHRAFTLVELLIVVAIITVLIGILLPIVGKSHEKANRAACLSNLHQIGASLIMYANANHGRLPNDNPGGENLNVDENLVLVSFANEYVKSPAAFHCPGSVLPMPTQINNSTDQQPNSSRICYDFYSVDWWDSDIGPIITRINGAPLAWDLLGYDPVLSGLQNHGNTGGNAVFTDGHAEWMPTSQWDPGWTWPTPTLARKIYLNAGNPSQDNLPPPP
jgi:prepilin-type N-terminal cleavage/methylation domain-containing protein/prepilin-type processing-associated H-X9-DG protein